MNDSKLFKEKTVPIRKLNEFEIKEKQFIARRYGIRSKLLETKKFNQSTS